MSLKLSDQEVDLLDRYLAFLDATKVNVLADSPSRPVTSDEQPILTEAIRKVVAEKLPHLAGEEIQRVANGWLQSQLRDNLAEYTELMKNYKTQREKERIDSIYNKKLGLMTGWEFQDYLLQLGINIKFRPRN